ncbi:hypothetical protein GGF31_003607 [Allomyces arbusculus]|nr:hypothetical protein GGF31_003607 [Allomyces arbusculus]
MADHAGAGSHAVQGNGAPAAEPAPTIRFIPYITDLHRGLNFPIVERKVPNGKVLKVKRFVEKGNVDFSDSIAFKSKVVSRQHGEIWTQGRKFYFRDTKSSSGTFINNVRIAPANSESPPIELHDGDIIQLGVDYQGRTEDIFRCVRIRIEVNREPYRNTAFRGQVVKALRAFAAATDTGDCCICLGPIAPFQALFIAPCCHTFHYKCSRPLLNAWPTFSCPLCRHYADLNASVSVENLSEFNDLDAEVPASPTGPGAASPPPEPSAQGSNEHIASPLPNAATANPPDEQHLGTGHATAGPANHLLAPLQAQLRATSQQSVTTSHGQSESSGASLGDVAGDVTGTAAATDAVRPGSASNAALAPGGAAGHLTPRSLGAHSPTASHEDCGTPTSDKERGNVTAVDGAGSASAAAAVAVPVAEGSAARHDQVGARDE